MGVIPWNKMERYIFGVNQHGIFKINRQTGKVWYSSMMCTRVHIKVLFVYCIFPDNIYTAILRYLSVEENWSTLPTSKQMNWQLIFSRTFYFILWCSELQRMGWRFWCLQQPIQWDSRYTGSVHTTYKEEITSFIATCKFLHWGL